MAAPSIRNTFIGGTSLDPSGVNENFQGFITDITDGTRDLNINALTTNGTVTLDGTILNIDAANPVWEFGAATTWTINNISTLDLSAADSIKLGGSAIDPSSSPVTNTVYPNSFPKAFGKLEVVAGPSMSVLGGFNVSAATVITTSNGFVVSYRTPMDASLGDQVAMGNIGHVFTASIGKVIGLTALDTSDSATIEFTAWDELGANVSANVVGNIYHFVVWGG